MSKSFDIIKRDILLKDLSGVLRADELHMFYLLLKAINFKVRINQATRDLITTNIGSVQGDCASAILFNFCLAKSLQPKRSKIEEHNYMHCLTQHPKTCYRHTFKTSPSQDICKH